MRGAEGLPSRQAFAAVAAGVVQRVELATVIEAAVARGINTSRLKTLGLIDKIPDGTSALSLAILNADFDLAALLLHAPGDPADLGGGGTVWDSMAYDPGLDLLYIGVGNGSPHSHYLRSEGRGDNLFLASVLALDPDTGEYLSRA